jgi:hypothetical protein
MAQVRYFKKLYTSIKETVEDDFIDGSDAKKTGDNVGLKFSTTLKNTTAGTLIKASANSASNGKDFEGTIEPEFKFQEYDLTLKGKFITDNTIEASILANDKLAKGSTIFLTGKIDNKLNSSVEVGLDYLEKGKGSLNLKVISPTDLDFEKVDIYGAAVGVYKNYSIGVDGKLNPDSQSIANWNSFIEYNHQDLTFALFSKMDKDKNIKKCGFGYSQDVNSSTKGALDFTYDHNKRETSMRVGTNYKVDTHTSLKSRFALRSTNEMRLGLVLKQNLTPTARVTLTSDINTRLLFDRPEKIEGAGHQFGVALSFFD